MGMSYDEFWNEDYRLTESYIKKNDLEIERETQNNWELVQYVRAAMWEITSAVHKDPKSSAKPLEFPSEPQPRTMKGRLRKERNESIAKEIRFEMQEKINNRRKSDDND